MGSKKTRNTRRLTKAQVRELLESEGKLHEEFTKAFEGLYFKSDRPQVYELSNDRFLYVFDPQGYVVLGRGDIRSEADLLRTLRWVHKVEEDYANNRGNSVAHWRYYSKHKAQLINKVCELIDELIECLEMSIEQLDFSYKSLDIVSSKSEEYGLEKVQADLYDNLVGYVGEVLRRRVKGEWIVSSDCSDNEFPAVCAKQNLLMPINVVFKELDGYEPMNLRKQTANEVRRFSLRCR